MRFRVLVESDLTDAQLAVYREVCAGPRGRLGPPTNVLLRCPELAGRTQKIGEYVRYQSSLPSRISEFAIMTAARYWTSQYEWQAHCPLALKAGLGQETADQLAAGKRPDGMKEDEAAAFRFCSELHWNKSVSDAAFNGAVAHFGEQGMVDLIGASGYYTLISMCLSVNQKSSADGVPPPLAPMKPGERLCDAPAAEARPAGGGRLPDLRDEEMSKAQRTACQVLSSGPGKSVSTPMKVLLRSPELAMRAQKVSEYLRFQARLPAALAQFGIIIAAKHWRAETMWHAHSLQATEAGLSPAVVAGLAREGRPVGMTPKEDAVYQFCTELHRDKRVSDSAFSAAMEQLGEQATVDLIGVSGYYTLAAMVLKVAHKALPPGTATVFL